MRHPLVNPSLAPYGFVFPTRQKRLDFEIDKRFGGINAEKVIARLWDRMHRMDAPRPLPIETIIHEILPAMATANRLFEPDFEFDGRPYLSRDIALLSSVVQWFGTNCGSCFLETPMCLTFPHPEREFTMKLAQELCRRDMVAFWAHVCNSRCNPRLTLLGDPCYYDRSAISVRDRAVVEGLMRWLGKRAGRSFIVEQRRLISNAHEAARRRFSAFTKQAIAA